MSAYTPPVGIDHPTVVPTNLESERTGSDAPESPDSNDSDDSAATGGRNAGDADGA